MPRYNLGCGDRKLKDWVNVDIREDADITLDLTVFPWPFEDKSADRILASHVLEHMTKHQAFQFIKESYRILDKYHSLDIAVPDMDKFIQGHQTGDWSHIDGYPWRDLNHLLGGDGSEPDVNMRHKYMYNYETLAYMLNGTGFKVLKLKGPGEFDTPKYAAISLYVRGVKV